MTPCDKCALSHIEFQPLGYYYIYFIMDIHTENTYVTGCLLIGSLLGAMFVFGGYGLILLI